jgi:hypothetical protein
LRSSIASSHTLTAQSASRSAKIMLEACGTLEGAEIDRIFLIGRPVPEDE